MKLLIDEHFAPSIAQQLRELGHDVVAVPEAGLRGASDPDLFAEAQRQQRAVLTENVADFLALDSDYRASQRPHWGLVLTSNRAFPRGKQATVGALVNALEALLQQSVDLEPTSLVHWLQRPT